MYITEGACASLSVVCFWQVKGDAAPDQLIAFAGCRCEARAIKYRDLLSAASNQTGAFQLAGSIGDAWPLDTQHFGEQVLTDPQYVLVTTVAHHEQPARQPLLEVVRAVARHRHQDLLEKGLGVSVHETMERRLRLHGSGERRPRHSRRISRDLHEQPDGGNGGPEDGLHRSATLPADRRRLNDAAVRINRNH